MSKFEIKVKDGDTGKVDMSVTHNGHQWTTIWFNKNELTSVISELQRYLEGQT